ncbi:MAG: glycosyltransferase family 4 protein [Snowella sp.]|nr:glycosyltransferase family 4 protein [Snowella sp.]
MKVVHIVGGDLTKGAGKGALLLHQGLSNIGVESFILTVYTENPLRDPSIQSRNTFKVNYIQILLRTLLEKAILLPYSKRKQHRAFNTGFFGGSIRNHPLVKEADIVNIHWVAQGPTSLYDMSCLSMPVVLTIRDMWPFTGGCHYTMECERYLEGCGKCPQLGSKNILDLSRLVSKAKANYLPQNLTCVGISEWISDRAQRSTILGNQLIQTISNCINTNVFSPIPVQIARAALEIPTDREVILVGAVSVTLFYKGFDLFLESLYLLKNCNPLILLFGYFNPSDIASIPFDHHSLGYISDDRLLRLIYSAADLFVAPSRQEAFGKTLVESMSCGTPVVCFDATGPKEIVKHQYSGYKAKPYDVNDLANGISWVLQNTEDFNLKINSRSHAVANFSQEIIAKKYLELYTRIYNDKLNTGQNS